MLHWRYRRGARVSGLNPSHTSTESVWCPVCVKVAFQILLPQEVLLAVVCIVGGGGTECACMTKSSPWLAVTGQAEGKTAEEVGQTHCLPSSHVAGLEDGMMMAGRTRLKAGHQPVTAGARRRRREGAEPEHRRRL